MLWWSYKVKQSFRGVLLKGVYKNFAKFTGEHLCQSLLYYKVAGGACNFKKETGIIIIEKEKQK